MPGRAGLFYFFNFKNYEERRPLEEGDKRTRGEITSILNSLHLLLYIINIQHMMGYDGRKPPMGQLLKALNFLCSREYPMQIEQNAMTPPFLQEIREDIAGIANEVGQLDFQLSSEAAGAAAAGPGLGPAVEDVVPRLNTLYLNRIADYKPLNLPSIESQIISFLRRYDAHNLYQGVTVNALVPMLIQEHVTKHALALDDAFGEILVQLFAAAGPSPETRADNLISMLADRLRVEQDPKIKAQISKIIVFLNEYKQQRLQQQQQQRLQQQQQQRLQQQQQQRLQQQQQQPPRQGGRRKSLSKRNKIKSKFTKKINKTNNTSRKKSRRRRFTKK
jgi:hypothetical protein